MKKAQLLIAQEFAKRNKLNPFWIRFKAKWNNRETPRRGTKAFAEFAHDNRI